MTKLVVSLSLIFGATIALAPPAAAAPAWSVVPSPSPPAPAGGTLLGVACPTTTACFTVGYYEPADTLPRKPLVGRFDGTNWSIVKGPVPPSSDYDAYSELSSIACPTSTNCFAVGEFFDGSAHKMLVERWNGATWSIVGLPKPSGATRTDLGGITCPTSTTCFAVGTYNNGSGFKTLVERWNGTSWEIVPSPNRGGADHTVLHQVSCATATNCLAIGTATTGSTRKPLAERWDGTSWSIVAAPIESSPTVITLAGVSCASSTMCFAVGSSRTPSTNDKPLIERWNGNAWSVVANPNPTTYRNRLHGVSCPSTTACFAVGEYSDGASLKTLVERWNGTSWSIVARPNAASNASWLAAVSCPTDTSCAAVGESLGGSDVVTLIQRWNGTTWSIAAKGGSRSGLQKVSCTSTSNCFAVGSFSSGAVTKTLIERWNGTSWSIVPSPNPTGARYSVLWDISCASDTSCIAVGRSHDGSSNGALIERWDGTSWVIVPSPTPAGATSVAVAGVSCIAATSCFAVGSFWDGSVTKTLIAQWNGTSWVIVPSPNPAGAQYPNLKGISCATATSCFAVGSFDNGSIGKTLIERWNGTSWVILASPNQVGASANNLNSVSCAAATSCFAVGLFQIGDESKPLVERWNGTNWVIVASGNQAGASAHSLASVSCASPTSCFAVGYFLHAGSLKTLIEQWNGTSWSIVTSPNPSGAALSQLAGVSCVGVASCFAVGTFNSVISDWTLVERYA